MAASMAIDRPEAIDGAPRRGLTAKERLSWLARNDGAAGRGRKFRRRCCGIGDRGAADPRPDKPIEEAPVERPTWQRPITGGSGEQPQPEARDNDRPHGSNN